MSDGAHFGVLPSQALGYILGGREPTERAMDPFEMQQWLLTAPEFGEEQLLDWAQKHLDGGETPYDAQCRWTARQMLEFFLANPRCARLESPELDVALAEAGIELNPGLTGFQFGWALNAARRCCELGPVQNGAIIDVAPLSEGDDE